jgi:hypothetical protein
MLPALVSHDFGPLPARPHARASIQLELAVAPSCGFLRAACSVLDSTNVEFGSGEDFQARRMQRESKGLQTSGVSTTSVLPL